jgi:hypothetical protein
MKRRLFIPGVLSVVALVGFGVAPLRSRARDSTTRVPVHMVVTVEAKHGTDVPVVTAEDVMVFQGKDRDPVTGWVPLQGDRAGLELFLLVDDAINTGLGAQLEDLRGFIMSQPPTTAIGVGYMRDGTVDILQNLTNDHMLAANAVRLPMGVSGAIGSPYLSIVDLIKRWPEGAVRREMLVVSDGIDRFGGTGPANPYVDTAIERAQRAGIIIYAI